jgi:hypothetical protein
MLRLVKLWIIISAGCVAAGWILSALKSLNVFGYLAFFLIFGVFGTWFWHQRRGQVNSLDWRVQARRFSRRFHRPLPLMFAIAAFLAALGGTIYAPNNYDALMYRVPRVLNWWSEAKWFWIPTANQAMNRSGTGFEWLMMPLLVFLRGDRPFYLINALSYCLMPGLIFSAFTGAGVSKRVAWAWMWVLPLGFCFVMEAGSIGNDFIGVIYILAALTFFFRAAQRSSVTDLRLAFLSAGLAIGVKAANLPLMLPIACAAWPARRLLRHGVLLNLLIIGLSLLVSFLPVAIFNQHFAGHWGGDPHNVERMTIYKPLSGFIGNTFQLVEQSLLPPILPHGHRLSGAIWAIFPERFRDSLMTDFPLLQWQVNELPQEESAGLGLGISLLALTSAIVALRHFRQKPQRRRGITGLLVGGMAWVAILPFMAKVGAPATGRLLASYYPLMLLPIVLHPSQSVLMRRAWWKFLAIMTGVAGMIALIITPSRPLWPAEILLGKLCVAFPKNEQLTRARTVYSVYRNRNDLFEGVRKMLPDSARVVGLIEGDDDPETSLWHPFGARVMVHLIGNARLRPREMKWVVVKNNVFGDAPGDFDKWLRSNGGNLVSQQTILEKVSVGPEEWSLVRF